MKHASIPDVEAFADVLDDLLDEASRPGMPVDRATALIAALETVRKTAGDVIALLNSSAVTALEGQAREIGGTVYVPKRQFKRRPNHDVIKDHVVQVSVVDENGEVVSNPAEAARRAVAFCYELFVSPKSAPKVTGLRRIHLSEEEAVIDEHTGTKVKVVET